MEYSLSPAETSGVPDSPITDPSTKDLAVPNVTITGLTPGEAYYIWVKAKNAIGDSGFNGPVQTNTEGTQNPGSINFGLTAVAFDKIDISWDQPAGKQFRFDLKRKETAEATFDIQLRDDEIPPAGTTFTHNDTKLAANTSYDYRLEIRNEFGQLIGTFNATVSTLDLPATVATIDEEGVFIEFTIDPPDGISIVEIEWNVASDFSGRGGTTEIARLPGNTDPIIGLTPRLNKGTQYYCRTRVKKNQVFGPYVNTNPTDVTTVNVNPPQELRSADANEIPGTGEVNLEFRFDNELQDQTSGLRCSVSYRANGQATEPFQSFETYDFGEKPFGDIGSDQFRYDFDTPFPIGNWEVRFEAFNEAGGSEPRIVFNVIVT